MTHYSRAEWRAEPARSRYRLEPTEIEGVALHWPATTTRLRDVPAVMAALRAWQRYHMLTRGWSDIAYQVAIDQAGNTYGLRGMRYRSAANGDQDLNHRFGAYLLVLAEGEEPTDALTKAVRREIATHRRIFPHSEEIVGHQDIRPEPTACPGPIVEALINKGHFEPATQKELAQ